MLTVGACAPAAGPAAPGGQTAAERPAAPQPTIVLAARGEPASLATKQFATSNGNFEMQRAFNATLSYKDEHEQAQPYLSATIPQLGTDSWAVTPDGRMTTTYRLKPDLFWQDGAPLTSNDFAFSYQVYSKPELGASQSTPIKLIAGIDAPDPSTVVIRWNQLYADAVLENGGFYPLPKHILEQPFQSQDAGAFVGNSFWTANYVGAGPFKLTEYAPGDHIDAIAFDNHVLGRARLDKIRFIFIADTQAGVANLLAGSIHYADRFVTNPTDGINLEQQWGDSKAGEVLWSPTAIRAALVQMRPEHADPKGLLDLRVRQAIAHGLDKQTAIDVLNYGKAIATSTITPPSVPYYAEIEKLAARYPYDPRLVAQRMGEAGFAPGPDGLFTDASGKRFNLGIWTSSGEKNVQEAAFFVDSLKRVGIDATQQVSTVQQLNDGMARALIPGISISGANNYRAFLSSEAAGPDNRWNGAGRNGWINAEYERAYGQYTDTLDFTQRVGFLARMEKVFTEQLPAIMLYFQNTPTVRVAALKGPQPIPAPGAAGGVLRIHEWSWSP
jgi:peptide/nickel transport system substrate-binding protein